MTSILNYKAKEVVLKMAKSNMTKIKVKSGICRYNFRCHNNAVHDALNNNDEKLAMCFYIDEDYPIIHFINIDKEGGYIDNTLGRWSEKYEYYLIKEIGKEDFFSISNIFQEYRKELNKNLPLHVRLLSNIEF